MGNDVIRSQPIAESPLCPVPNRIGTNVAAPIGGDDHGATIAIEAVSSE